MIKDPICGMEVENEQFAFGIGGKKYFFCSQGCLEEFRKSSDEGSGKLGVHDLVIIGAGPAGLSAAVKASVLKIDTLLIAKDFGGRAVESVKIKNYQFLCEHYLEHRIDEVVKINRKGGIFEVLSKEGTSTTAYAIIIATGIRQIFSGGASAPNTEFCRELLKLSEKGEMVINSDCSTNVEGIFACGNDDEGVKATSSAKKYLQEMGIT
jgi:thioredoxin reductase/YHS domain-containing protein